MDQKSFENLILSIHASQAAMQVCVDEIKKDLKEHMKRTHQNEVYIRALEAKQQTDLDYVRKHIYWVQGALALVSILGTIVGISKYLKVF